MRFKVKVTEVEKTEIEKVISVSLSNETLGLSISLELPADLYRLDAGEELNFCVSKEQLKEIPDDALLMSGYVYKLVKDDAQKASTYYISVGGYQLRLKLATSVEGGEPLSHMDKVYIALHK